MGWKARAAMEQADAMQMDAQTRQMLGYEQKNLMGSQEKLQAAQTSEIAPNALSQRTLQGAQTGMVGAETAEIGPNAVSHRSLEAAQEAEGRARVGLMGSEMGVNTARIPNINMDTQIRGLGMQPISPEEGGAIGDAIGGRQLFNRGTADVRPVTAEEAGALHDHLTGKAAGGNLKLTAGDTKVPGKGDGTVDKVPAMLAPGEAVLNKPAAEKLGRDNIAALNAVGHAEQQAGKQAPAPAGKAPAQKTPGKPAGGHQAKAAPSAPAKGAKPAGKAPGKPAPQGFSKGCSKVQELAKGTHEVKAGKSATTPKIDPGALQALAGMLGQGGGGGMVPPGGAPGAGGPPQVGGGKPPMGRGMV
jgi:hypothetical protein